MCLIDNDSDTDNDMLGVKYTKANYISKNKRRSGCKYARCYGQRAIEIKIWRSQKLEKLKCSTI